MSIWIEIYIGHTRARAFVNKPMDSVHSTPLFVVHRTHCMSVFTSSPIHLKIDTQNFSHLERVLTKIMRM